VPAQTRRHLSALLAAPLALVLSGCPGPAPTVESTPPRATPAPAATPPPEPYVPGKRLETAKMFNGMQLRSSVETEHGTTATADRNDPASYTLDLQLKVRIPKPHRDLAEVVRLNDQLPIILPTLPRLLETAKVSPVFDELYRLKVESLQRGLARLDVLLSRHNFYDCETILEIESPTTKRRALFIQADMDVDSDGSDSDRVPDNNGVTSTFQPFTSYRWAKKGTTPNSFLIPREAKLKQHDQELAKGGLSPAKVKEIKGAQAQLRLEIDDLKKSSYLVGQVDPFIVLPGSMFGKEKTPYSPIVGDYCVVIAGGVLYPAIIGDVGPRTKMGEASTRICKQLNPASTLYNRPVNDLKVTYLVFPQTSERPFDVPDLEKWRTRCAALLDELGGHQGELFVWEDLTKEKVIPPPVAPVPVPVPVPPGIVPPVVPATPAPATVPPAEGAAPGAEPEAVPAA
jgi:hypothetical protein